MIVSVCGKGGSGKSVLTSLLAHESERRGYAVFVVDADESNSGLYSLLGLESPPRPLMDFSGGKEAIKSEMGKGNILAEDRLSPDSLPGEYVRVAGNIRLAAVGKIHQALEGCACPMGVLNREFLKKLELAPGEIAFVDMEAGVEHFGRGVEEAVDYVLLAVEPSMESLQLATRIQELASGMGKNTGAVLNKVSSGKWGEKLEQWLTERGISVVGSLPEDPSIFEACLEGEKIEGSRAAEAVSLVLDQLLKDGGER
jgi:CO dehydrogenase maturation factor